MVSSKLPQLRGFWILEMLPLSFVKTETKVYKVKLGYEHKNKSKTIWQPRLLHSLTFYLRTKWWRLRPTSSQPFPPHGIITAFPGIKGSVVYPSFLPFLLWNRRSYFRLGLGLGFLLQFSALRKSTTTGAGYGLCLSTNNPEGAIMFM